MAQTEPQFLTTREVAALLRVRERKVYDMAAGGEIPHRRVTGKLLFPRAEIEAWLTGAAVESPAPPTMPQRPAPPAVVAGSHDPLLDWAIRASGSELASFVDGSLDGLERLGTGQAVAAGLHVYEPETGGWNTAHLAAALADRPVVLIEWARRQQGLILAPGLAGSVRGIGDLRGRRVAQRQASAGAGLLLDALMASEGVAPGEIAFLPEPARTETEAAAAVATGKADAAPGLAAVARQFGLDFAPTLEERFDLAVDRRSYFEPAMQALFRFARTQAFAEKAEELGGYRLDGHGTVHWNGA